MTSAYCNIDTELKKVPISDPPKISLSELPIGLDTSSSEIYVRDRIVNQVISDIFPSLKTLSEKSIGQGGNAEVYLETFNGIRMIRKELQTKQYAKIEYFIGKFGVNPIRDRIPNFIYTYAIDGSNIYLEYVQGKLLPDIISELTEEDFVSVLLQILFALQTAQYYNDFTHYDLQPYNIIITPLESKKKIRYYFFKKESYIVETKYLVRIIDYSFSSFLYKNKRYGMNIPDYNVFNKVSTTTDLYRLYIELFKKGPVYGMNDKEPFDPSEAFSNVYQVISNFFLGMIEKGKQNTRSIRLSYINYTNPFFGKSLWEIIRKFEYKEGYRISPIIKIKKDYLSGGYPENNIEIINNTDQVRYHFITFYNLLKEGEEIKSDVDFEKTYNEYINKKE